MFWKVLLAGGTTLTWCHDWNTTFRGQKGVLVFGFLKIAALLKCHLHTIKFIVLKCKIPQFLVSSQSCAAITTFTVKTFHHPQKKPLPHQHSLSLWQLVIYFLLLRISYFRHFIMPKWNNAICGYFCFFVCVVVVVCGFFLGGVWLLLLSIRCSRFTHFVA